jgi:hypothetical protein
VTNWLRRARAASRAPVRAALPGWIVARLLVFGAWATTLVAVDHLEPHRTVQQQQGLFAWDGAFYRLIAEYGYRPDRRDALRFFPLYPALGRLLSPLVLGHTGLALIIVANVAALAFGALCYQIVVSEGGGVAVGRRAAWLAALFPPAFVFVWAYSEAVMVAFAAAALLAARRGRWGVAAACGLAAALTRPTGVVLALAIGFEALRVWRRPRTETGGERRTRAAAAVATIAPLAGLGAYLAWAGVRFDDWRAPIRLQSDLRGHTVEPIGRLLRAIGDLAGQERLGAGLHAPFALTLIVLVVVVARRLPGSYALYAGGVVVLALSAENINSLERYGLNAFPLVLGAAFVLRGERLERAGFALCAAGLTALTVLAWLGAYVP